MNGQCECSGSSSNKCTNVNCKNYDEFENILVNCERKTISGVADCPSIRSCPHCKEAIEHVEACYQMECYNCKKKFCFICLVKANDGESFQCANQHHVAPIQRNIICDTIACD